MTKIRSNHTLLGIWAHPDDETYLSAGLMARAARAGARVVCAFATAGEAGTDDPEAWPPERLARQRDREVRRALALAGAEPPIHLGYADGRCPDVPAVEATSAVDQLLDRISPTHVVTFGSDGVTGHPDHRAVSSWVLRAWVARRERGLFVPELMLAALDPAWLVKHRSLHDEIGLFAWDPPRATHPYDVTARVRLKEWELDLKRGMLAAHASQTEALARMVGERRYRRWWGTELFRSPDADELAVAELEVLEGAST